MQISRLPGVLLRNRSLLRRCLSILLIVSMIGLLIPASLAPRPVDAQGLCPGLRGVIVQCGALGTRFFFAVEQPAIIDLLDTFQLPPSDFDRLVDSQRDLVRSAIFAGLLNIIQKAPDQRTSDEQIAVDKLASIVQANRIEAAEAARREYDKWAADMCHYSPPGLFAGTYQPGGICLS